MIITVDVGNTNIVMGVYENDKLKFTARIATEASKTEDEYAALIVSILSINKCSPNNIEGAIISSVVPPLNPVLKAVMVKLFECRVLLVSPGMKTGLNIKLDNPAILGADLVCAAVCAMRRYTLPCVIFDLGTATTISALDRNGVFLGGSITPGVGVSLAALSSSTAQLPHIDVEDYNSAIIGTTTIDAMRSGVILGTASMIDGMLARYRTVLGIDAVAIATGGLSPIIIPHCTSEIIVDSGLLSDGLYMLYKMNTKSAS